ncbi:MAG TPA: M23 family metallopeptidase [Longimicrobiales bacterium]
MARRQWTLLIFDDAEMRQFQIPRKWVRNGGIAAFVVLSVLVALAIGFFVKEGQRLRAARLEKENSLLAQEVKTIRSRLAILESSLDDLADKDEYYRLLAGLEPIDEQVQQAGIGGPGTATLGSSELYRLDPEQGAATFAAAYDLDSMIRRARLLAMSWSEATDSLAAEYDRLESHPSILPTRGYVSSRFSRRRWHPILNIARAHEGIDIVAPRGAPIFAAAKGRVTYAGRRGGYGLMVEVDHGHGYVTRYAHASRVVVKRGQRVERGDKLAEVGETGLAVAPHLHYEVLKDGQPINPVDFIFEEIPD